MLSNPASLRPCVVAKCATLETFRGATGTGPNQVRNRVEIGSESGPGGGVRVGRCWRGRSGLGGVPVAPPESLYATPPGLVFVFGVLARMIRPCFGLPFMLRMLRCTCRERQKYTPKVFQGQI